MNILVIADKPDLQHMIQNSQVSVDATAVIFEASSTQEALKRMQSNPISIVFLEINMRKMNGLAFIEAHKRAFPAVCWLVISEFKNFYDVQKAIQLGVSDYLLKPLEESVIDRILDKHHNRKLDTPNDHRWAACP